VKTIGNISTGNAERTITIDQRQLFRPSARIKVILPTSCKTPEFFKKSPLSGAEKHSDFTVTLCLQNVTTDVDFAYIESE